MAENLARPVDYRLFEHPSRFIPEPNYANFSNSGISLAKITVPEEVRDKKRKELGRIPKAEGRSVYLGCLAHLL
jgi:hypothetical protein